MTTALHWSPAEKREKSARVSFILCCRLWVCCVEEWSVILDFAFICRAVLTPPFNEDLVEAVSVWKRYEVCFITQQCDSLSLLIISERDIIVHTSCSPSSSLQHTYASSTGFRIHFCLHSGSTGCKFSHLHAHTRCHVMHQAAWLSNGSCRTYGLCTLRMA